jgi:hypothetical protein
MSFVVATLIHTSVQYVSHSTNIGELSLQPKLPEPVFHYWHITAVFSNVVCPINEIHKPNSQPYIMWTFHSTRTFRSMVLRSLILQLDVY